MRSPILFVVEALLFSLPVAVSSSAAFKPVELVDIQAIFHADRLADHVGQRSSAGTKPLQVISSIGPLGTGKRALLNKIFGADFEESCKVPSAADQPVCLASVAPAATDVLVMDSDGSGVGGASEKIVALQSRLADVVMLHIWHADIGRIVPSNDASLRSLLGELARHQSDETASKQRLVLLFAVHNFDGDESKDAASLTSMLTDEVDAVWQSLDPPTTTCPVDVKLQLLPIERFEPEAHKSAVTSLKKLLLEGTSSSKGALLREDVSSSSERAWQALDGFASPLPSSEVLEARYRIDQASQKFRESANRCLRPWKTSLERGWCIANFGVKASSLRDDIISQWDEATREIDPAGFLTSFRTEKRAELVAEVDEQIISLYEAQVSDLMRQSTTALSANLLKLLDSSKEGEVEEERMKSSLRKAEFKFASDLSRLSVPDLELDGVAQQEAHFDTLTEISQQFDESSPARISKMHKMSQKAQRSRQLPKKERSFIPGIHLAAMLRGFGEGSLQSFCNYAGGRNSVTVGYANDLGSPASRARDYDAEPFLRLQPKIQFDIDL